MTSQNTNRPEAARNSLSRRCISNSVDSRDIHLQRYVDKSVSGILETARATRNGGRNLAINNGAYAGGRLLPYISRSRIENDLLAVGKELGLDEIEARATIKSGLDAGEKNPRDLSHIEQGSVSSNSYRWVARRREQKNRAAQVEQSEQRKRNNALRVWQRALSVIDTMAETYLHARGIIAPLPGNVRFLTSFKHLPSGKYFPVCLFAIETAPGGKMLGIQRVYLHPDGMSKAPVKPPKMALAGFKGGGIWFGEPAETLVIVEGPEDALTIWMSGKFVVSAVSASNMSNLAIPPMVQKIIIGADHGQAGEAAADKAAKIYLQQGYQVRIAFPPIGHDWNSLWLTSGQEVAI